MSTLAIRFPLFAGLILFLVGFPAAGQMEHAPAATSEPKTAGASTVEQLSLRDTVAFSTQAASGFLPGLKCDANGNIFGRFPITNPATGTLANSPVSKLDTGSGQVTFYGAKSLADADYPNQMWLQFDVDQRGRVYGLIHTRQPATGTAPSASNYYIEKFKDDGSMDSIIHVDLSGLGRRARLYQFAVFAGGNLFATGITGDADSLQPFTAVYDSLGHLMQRIVLPEDASLDDYAKTSEAISGSGAANDFAGSGSPRGASSDAVHAKGDVSVSQRAAGSFDASIATTSVSSGTDGNIYLLRNTVPLRLYVLDSTGTVQHHFKIAVPMAGLVPFSMGPAQSGEVYFDFEADPALGLVPGGQRPDRLVGVFSTVSGQFEGLYRPPLDALRKTVPACADRRGGFFFLGTTTDNQHLAVFRYTP